MTTSFTIPAEVAARLSGDPDAPPDRQRYRVPLCRQSARAEDAWWARVLADTFVSDEAGRAWTN